MTARTLYKSLCFVHKSVYSFDIFNGHWNSTEGETIYVFPMLCLLTSVSTQIYDPCERRPTKRCETKFWRTAAIFGGHRRPPTPSVASRIPFVVGRREIFDATMWTNRNFMIRPWRSMVNAVYPFETLRFVLTSSYWQQSNFSSAKSIIPKSSYGYNICDRDTQHRC